MNPIRRIIVDLDWITAVLVIGLILLSMGKYFFKSSFFNFIILPFNNKYITLNKRKGKLLHGFHIIMSIFQIVNLALFFFVAKNVFQQQPIITYTEFFAVIIIGLFLFLLIKMLLQIGNGYFFENQELMTELIFEKITYFNYAGLMVFVGNILAIYIFPGSIPLIYIIIMVALIINGIGIVKMLRNYQKLIMGNTFYFILYLCTLEISPIAIIISYLNS